MAPAASLNGGQHRTVHAQHDSRGTIQLPRDRLRTDRGRRTSALYASKLRPRPAFRRVPCASSSAFTIPSRSSERLDVDPRRPGRRDRNRGPERSEMRSDRRSDSGFVTVRNGPRSRERLRLPADGAAHCAEWPGATLQREVVHQLVISFGRLRRRELRVPVRAPRRGPRGAPSSTHSVKGAARSPSGGNQRPGAQELARANRTDFRATGRRRRARPVSRGSCRRRGSSRRSPGAAPGGWCSGSRRRPPSSRADRAARLPGSRPASRLTAEGTHGRCARRYFAGPEGTTPDLRVHVGAIVLRLGGAAPTKGRAGFRLPIRDSAPGSSRSRS